MSTSEGYPRLKQSSSGIRKGRTGGDGGPQDGPDFGKGGLFKGDY